MEYRKTKDEDDHNIVNTDLESLKEKSHTVASSNIDMATLGVGSSERINRKRKGVVTCALTILTSSQAILIVWLKRAGKYEYSVTAANFLVDTLKCALCLLVLTRIWENEGVTDDKNMDKRIRYAFMGLVSGKLL